MIDYAKYREIKTEEVTCESINEDFINAFSNRVTKVNKAVEKLLSDGYEIVDIKYDNVTTGHNNYQLYATATITYGKLKNNKK